MLTANSSSKEPDVYVYKAVRSEVMAGDIRGLQELVDKSLLGKSKDAKRYFQALTFYIQDYDDDPRELYHIKECRSWFQKIDRVYPFLIYFIPCLQYTLYVGAQQNMDGAQLTVENLWTFLHHRDLALQELAQDMEEPYDRMKDKIQRSFWEYSKLELKTW